MIRVLLISLAVASVMAGCGRRFAMQCEDPELYAGSQEIPPVRVPGDLAVPPETEALRIPQSAQQGGTEPASGRGPCLESPPGFFEGNADPASAEEESDS